MLASSPRITVPHKNLVNCGRLHFARWIQQDIPFYVLLLQCNNDISPLRVGLIFPPLEYEWNCDQGANYTMWLLRLSHKRQYSLCLVLSGSLALGTQAVFWVQITWKGSDNCPSWSSNISHQICEWCSLWEDSSFCYSLIAAAMRSPVPVSPQNHDR